MDPTWYTLDTSTVLNLLHSSKEGLDTPSARSRLLQNGPNLIPKEHTRSAWLQFFSQLTSPIIAILGIAAALKVYLGQIGDASVIGFVVVFNTLLGYFQEKRAAASLESLRKLSCLRAKVFRDGILVEINAEHIVPGDVIHLESGTRISADARLLETHTLDVDESMLTGESTVVRKNATPQGTEQNPPEDTSVLVFAGTIVTRGRAQAVVIATGKNTRLAAIVSEAEAASPPPSPLEKRMTSFGHSIALLTLSMMAVIALIGLWRGFALSDLIMTCVSLTVSAVPEGLPIAITLILSHGLFQMAKRNAIVRKLGTVETLGCTTVICTDKTGTLTQNSMTVGKTSLGLEEGMIWAARIAYFCSETRLEETGFIGDPVEAALMRFAKQSGFLDEVGWSKELVLPFESEQQMMACSISKNGTSYTVWKGSFDALQKKCLTMWSGNTIVPFDAQHMNSLCQNMTQDGLKVLSLAYGTGNDPQLTMVGLVGLIDPPREEVRDAIHSCQQAGIRVVMITGDDAKTASTIAKEIGLQVDLLSHRPLTGADVDRMNDASLFKAVQTTPIFARVTPLHKLRIVQQLQKAGEVVAMTGDGVNDAPPLRQADIGIAMGDGTDVAKEASAMVIVDNNFASIVEAIRRGRVMFRSLQQMVVYLLTTCFGGIMTIAMSILLALPLPILPLQLLWINLVTDGTTTIPLSLEGEHGNIMKAPPRKQNSPFISRLMFGRALLASFIMMAGTITVFTWALHIQHTSIDYARTMAFTTLALFQIVNALNSRSVRRSLFFTYHSPSKGELEPIPFFQNIALLATIAMCTLLQVLAVELPFLQTALRTTPLHLGDWASIIVIASSVIVIVEVHKALMFFFTKKTQR
jgi:Ca2+-transporting ATPase